jgi:hypothetical protein
MGSDVVEYQLSKLYGKNLLQRTNINIPSTMADNPEELKKFLFKQMKQK